MSKRWSGRLSSGTGVLDRKSPGQEEYWIALDAPR